MDEQDEGQRCRLQQRGVPRVVDDAGAGDELPPWNSGLLRRARAAGPGRRSQHWLPAPSWLTPAALQAARTWLAAKKVGRWPVGAPLALAPSADDLALADENDLRNFRADAAGRLCPVGAHVRRANA